MNQTDYEYLCQRIETAPGINPHLSGNVRTILMLSPEEDKREKLAQVCTAALAIGCWDTVGKWLKSQGTDR